MAPLISIVIPTKDRVDQLKRLLDSIYKSTYKQYEVLIINNSHHLLKLKHKKLSIIENKENKGLAFARTLGAKKSKGKYVLFIDDDNIIDKNMIENLVKALEENPPLSAVGPLTYYFSNKKKIWFLSSCFNFTTSKPSFEYEIDSKKIQNAYLYPTQNLHNCFMVKKTIGDKVKWFDEFIFMGGTELDMFMKIKQSFPQNFLATVLNAYSYHDVPLSKDNFLRNLGFENEKRVYYFQRNRGVLVGRYGNLFNKISLGLFFYPLFFLMYLSLFIYFQKKSFILAHIKGTIEGYYYLFSKK